MNNPLISVVLSTYNDERYIKESIDAVLGQSFVDFEFIIWNDGSTDSTEEIIKTYRDDRIRYFYHENTGLGKALALACKQARGKYIARIDGDDICFPYRFEKEVAILESHPEVVLVSSSVYYIDENGVFLGRSYPWTWDRNIKRKLNIVHPAAMFRREIYENTCGYLDIKSAQDRILWSKLAKYGKFHIINMPLIKYRWIQTSLSHAIDPSSPYATILELIRQKLCSDEHISSIDIEYHNQFYQLSKKNGKTAGGEYHVSLEEKMGRVLSAIIGVKMSNAFITLLKNIYAFFRY